MIRVKFKLKAKDFKTKRKSLTVPNQALSIKDIVSRFTRGLPVDIQIKNPVYLDQDEHDFNKLSNMDSVEKSYQATEQRERAEQLKREIESNERAAAEAKQQENEEKARQQSERNTGIEDLDNTMPDDTDTDTQSLSRGRKKNHK